MCIDDDFLFQEEGPDSPEPSPAKERPWLALIVDDDPEVHAMTRLVMKKFAYRGRPLNFMSAYSSDEALQILRADPGVAVILLDVVMETDDAGLTLVPRIRDELGMDAVRIILRTGQPGQAPEDAVIHGYDINDYKAKTELTAQKLGSSMVAALRSYEHIMAQIRTRRGLERVMSAGASLSVLGPLDRFAETALEQAAKVLEIVPDGLVCMPRGQNRNDAQILAGVGRHNGTAGMPLAATVDRDLAGRILGVLQDRASSFTDDLAILCLRTANGRDAVCCLHTGHALDDVDRKLAEVLAAKIGIGLDNLNLFEQLRRAHRASIIALAGLAEYKDPEVGGEKGLRLSRMATEIAFALRADPERSADVTDEFLDMIAVGSMVYDIGMVGVPDRILSKPGPLDEAEWAEVRLHPERGGALLEKASRMVEGSNYLSFGAVMARAHHERWDGAGYPASLAGDAIPLAARIVAVADAFDALTRRRPWRDALPLDEAIRTIGEGSGTRFDPRVVDAFLRIMPSRNRAR